MSCQRTAPTLPNDTRDLPFDADGDVIVSVYSSGAIGRLLPEDVAGLVNYLKAKQPA